MGALEHAVELVRLALAADTCRLDEALDELDQDQRLRTDRHLGYLTDLDRTTGGSHRDLIEQGRALHNPARKEQPRSTKRRFAAVPSGGRLYDVYSRLSENTHSGPTSASAYLIEALKHDRPVPDRPDPTAWAETLALLSWSCAAADDAMLRFLVGGEVVAARHAPLMATVGLTLG